MDHGTVFLSALACFASPPPIHPTSCSSLQARGAASGPTAGAKQGLVRPMFSAWKLQDA